MVGFAFSQNIFKLLFYQIRGNYKKVAMEWEKYVPIAKETYGEKDTVKYKEFLFKTGNSYFFAEDYEKAIFYYLEIEKVYYNADKNCKNTFLADTQNDIGAIYRILSDYKNAELYFLKSCKIYGQIYGEKNKYYAMSLNNLGVVYSDIGNFQKSEEYHLKVLGIRKLIYGDESTIYAESLNNLGCIYNSLGNYEKAEEFYLNSLNIYLKNNVINSNYVQVLNNLGVLYSNLFNNDKAENYFLQSLDIKKDVLKEEDLIYALTLNNIGCLYYNSGNYEKAEEYYLSCLEIRKRILTEESLEYAQLLNNFANLYVSLKDYKKSEKYYLKSLQIFEKYLGDEHQIYAQSLNNIGVLYYKLEDYQKAEYYYLKSIEINKKILDEKHPDYAQSLTNLASLYTEQEDYEKAEYYWFEYNKNLNIQISENFKFMTESEKVKFNEIVIDKFDRINFFYFLYQNPDMYAIAYDNELAHKGMILNSTIAFKQTILNSNDTLVKNIYSQLLGTKQTLSKLYTLPIAERYFDVDSLEEVANVFEKQLNKRLQELGFEDLTGFKKNTWTEVQNSLKEDEVAIEFINFKYSGDSLNLARFLKPRKVSTKISDGDEIYCALVLTKEMTEPKMIFLFAEDELDSLFYKNDFLTTKEIIKIIYSNSENGNKLYQTIWQPLDSLINNKTTVYISPSGLLNQISFSAIPYNDSLLLSDKYTIKNLSSSSKIIKPSEYYLSKTTDIVLFGGLEYYPDSTKFKKTLNRFYNEKNEFVAINRSSYIENIPDSLQNRGLTWKYLSGTQIEVNYISKILTENCNTTNVYDSINGCEEMFNSLSNNSPEILHFATHGFYFPYTRPQIKDLNIINNENTFKYSENPMLRSGLLLAGGGNGWNNKILTGKDDGILTSYEVSQINLSSTKLVVLSACQTGLGDLSGSEGVFGLQRGFKSAGVEYMIVSLWKVPDQQTQKMMGYFYENLIANQEVKLAFANAQNKMKHEYKDYTFPEFYWAAFVLIQ